VRSEGRAGGCPLNLRSGEPSRVLIPLFVVNSSSLHSCPTILDVSSANRTLGLLPTCPLLRQNRQNDKAIHS